MGHESQIEPWSPKLTTFGFVGFGTDRLRCEEAMKTADSEKPKPRGRLAPQPSTWRGRSEQISLDQVGCEQEKVQPKQMCFFLTSPFIELTRSCGLSTPSQCECECEFKSRESINLRVSRSAPPLQPTPTPVSTFRNPPFRSTAAQVS